MVEKVILKQFKNKAKQPVAGLTPEHAIYDKNGVRLDAKLGNVNLQEFRDLQQQGVNAIKSQETKSIQAVAAREQEILSKSDASEISFNNTDTSLSGTNVQDALVETDNKVTELEKNINDNIVSLEDFLDIDYKVATNLRLDSTIISYNGHNAYYIPIIKDKEYKVDFDFIENYARFGFCDNIPAAGEVLTDNSSFAPAVKTHSFTAPRDCFFCISFQVSGLNSVIFYKKNDGVGREIIERLNKKTNRDEVAKKLNGVVRGISLFKSKDVYSQIGTIDDHRLAENEMWERDYSKKIVHYILPQNTLFRVYGKCTNENDVIVCKISAERAFTSTFVNIESSNGNYLVYGRTTKEMQHVLISVDADSNDYGCETVSFIDESTEDNSNAASKNIYNDEKKEEGIISITNGDISINGSYYTSDYIEVKPGQNILFSHTPGKYTTQMNARRIAAFNSSKTIIPSAGKDDGNYMNYIVPEGVSYIRFSFNTAYYSIKIMAEVSINGNPSSYTPYGVSQKDIHCFLPRYVYVAVDRTIELYNSQVCLEHNKYHLRWICDYGTATRRKFSVKGTSAMANSKGDATLLLGQHRLVLEVVDDDMNVVWSGQTFLCVASNANNATILPIGDSLTNWKRWLPEVMYLSGNKIAWIGTRYSGADEDSNGGKYPEGTIHHEGRSGFAAKDYLNNTSYTFDTRYDGSVAVGGTTNPFWNGTKFSLTHYLSTQGKVAPSAVQIFLGTNDLKVSVTQAHDSIVNIVNSITTEYPNMKVFICNTIYRSIQDGYGSIGSDGYAAIQGSSDYEYNENFKVFELMKKLHRTFMTSTNVHLIPIAVTHDSEFNFGSHTVKVNPRAEQNEIIPIESIHPQNQGYYQIADEMYSAYCWCL